VETRRTTELCELEIPPPDRRGRRTSNIHHQSLHHSLSQLPSWEFVPNAAKRLVRLLLQRTAKPSPLSGHTSSQTPPPFGTRCQPCRHSHGSHCASVVSRKRSNPTQSVSPSLCVACTVPTDTVQREVPTLVISYCAT